MTEKMKAKEQLEKIKEAIDCMDMDRLWKLTTEDPAGVFGKISVRMVGKKRVQALYHYLLGSDTTGKTFEALLRAKVKKELSKEGGEK